MSIVTLIQFILSFTTEFTLLRDEIFAGFYFEFEEAKKFFFSDFLCRIFDFSNIKKKLISKDLVGTIAIVISRIFISRLWGERGWN